MRAVAVMSKHKIFLKINDNTKLVLSEWSEHFYLIEVYGIIMAIIHKIIMHFHNIIESKNRDRNPNIYKYFYIIKSHLIRVAKFPYKAWLNSQEQEIQSLVFVNLDLYGKRIIQTIAFNEIGFKSISLPKLYWLIMLSARHYVGYALKYYPEMEYDYKKDEQIVKDNNRFYPGEFLSDMIKFEEEVMNIPEMTNENDYGQRVHCVLERKV